MTAVEDTTSTTTRQDARAVAEEWLAAFGRALATTDVDAAVALFAPDASWRDLLAFSWHLSTYSDPGEIAGGLRAHARDRRPRDFRVVDRVPPQWCPRAGREVVESYYEFSTDAGECEGVLRLVPDGSGGHVAWTLMSALREIRGHEPRIGARRPRTDQDARFGETSWAAKRTRHTTFDDREPAVLIVGAGQSGLSLAAHLHALGVDALVVEKEPRVGDNWRNRYESLVLHTETPVNHLPYLPFPETFPDFVPKDMLANWLETYADVLDLSVWTGTEFLGGEYDETSGAWTARLRRKDGSVRELRPRHVVVAVGLSSTPNLPDVPGRRDFAGPVVHSSEFSSGEPYAGKKAIIFGAGNSGCDIAQDLHAYGVAEVTLVQRGAMTVISLDAAIMIFSLYSSGLSTEDCDLLGLADPYPVMIKAHQVMTEVIKEMDRDMQADLRRGGFHTQYGDDESGSAIQYFRKGGGYYVNIGVAKLIGSGEVGVRQYDDVERIDANGVVWADGSRSDADLLVFATGYQGVRPALSALFGDEVADRVGPVWGFDESGELRNMFTRIAQPGLWFLAGGLPHARWFSRYTALQLQACELGLIPVSAPDPA